jgi:hypothetical protein
MHFYVFYILGGVQVLQWSDPAFFNLGLVKMAEACPGTSLANHPVGKPANAH